MDTFFNKNIIYNNELYKVKSVSNVFIYLIFYLYVSIKHFSIQIY